MMTMMAFDEMGSDLEETNEEDTIMDQNNKIDYIEDMVLYMDKMIETNGSHDDINDDDNENYIFKQTSVVVTRGNKIQMKQDISDKSNDELINKTFELFLNHMNSQHNDWPKRELYYLKMMMNELRSRKVLRTKSLQDYPVLIDEQQNNAGGGVSNTDSGIPSDDNNNRKEENNVYRDKNYSPAGEDNKFEDETSIETSIDISPDNVNSGNVDGGIDVKEGGNSDASANGGGGKGAEEASLRVVSPTSFWTSPNQYSSISLNSSPSSLSSSPRSESVITATTTTTVQYDVFLSHRQEDTQDFCQSIYDRLVHIGLKVFLDRRAAQLLHDLPLIVANCKVFIFILSSNIFKSNWCLLELNAAIQSKVPCVCIKYEGASWNGDKFPNLNASYIPKHIENYSNDDGAKIEVIPLLTHLFKYKAVEHSREYFEAFFDKLKGRIEEMKPNVKTLSTQTFEKISIVKQNLKQALSTEQLKKNNKNIKNVFNKTFGMIDVEKQQTKLEKKAKRKQERADAVRAEIQKLVGKS